MERHYWPGRTAENCPTHLLNRGTAGEDSSIFLIRRTAGYFLILASCGNPRAPAKHEGYVFEEPRRFESFVKARCCEGIWKFWCVIAAQ